MRRPPSAIANVSMLQAKLKAEQENSQRLTEELADVNVRAAPPRLSHRLPPACPTLVASHQPSQRSLVVGLALRGTVQKTLQEERMIRDVQRKDLEKTRATLTGPSPAPSTPAAGADVWCAASRKDGGGADAAGGRGEPAEDAGDGDAVRIGCARALQHRRLIAD